MAYVHFEFDRVEIFRAYPSLKPHILFYSKDLAIWHGFPDITQDNNGCKSIILN